MTPRKKLSPTMLITILLACLTVIFGLTLFSILLGSILLIPAAGRKFERIPSIPTRSLALLRSESLPTVTSTIQPAITETPTSPAWIGTAPVPDPYRGLLTNGSRAENKVALTFDLCETDGDLAGYDAKIIQILNRTQTPATLFLGGLWMRDHAAETLELGNDPLFELGNHSWSHEDFSAIPREEMEGEVLQAQQMMAQILGYQTNLFRLPYGTYTDEALDLINDNGLYIIQWDDVSGDPDPNIDAKSMTRWVLQQVQPGSIIIMHANGRGWHTAEALPGIIESLRQQGYTLVTVSELLQIPPYK